MTRRFLPVIPIAVAGVFAFLLIGRKSFWGDEAFSVALARLDWPSFWHVIANRQANQGLYYLLLKLWLPVGESEAAVRSLSALAAVGAVAALYAVAARLFGRTVGALAALLLAGNAFLVHYAQEARGYTLALFLATVSTLLFVRLVQTPSRLDLVLYVAVGALSVYAHFFSAFVLVAHAVTLAALRERPVRNRILGALAAVGVLGVPLALFVATRDAGQVDLIPGASPYRFVATFGALAGGTIPMLAVYLLLSSAAVLSARRRRGLDWRYLLVLSWLLAPILGAVVLSLAKPLFLARFMLVALPGFVLLAALGLHRLRRPWAAAAAALALLAFSAHALAGWYEGEEKEGLNFRTAAEHVFARSRPTDGIVFYRPSRRLPFEEYRRSMDAEARAPAPLFPPSPWGRFDLVGDYEARRPSDSTWRELAERAAARHDRVWLVHGERELFEDERRMLVAALEAAFERREARVFGELEVSLFSAPG